MPGGCQDVANAVAAVPDFGVAEVDISFGVNAGEVPVGGVVAVPGGPDRTVRSGERAGEEQEGGVCVRFRCLAADFLPLIVAESDRAFLAGFTVIGAPDFPERD